MREMARACAARRPRLVLEAVPLMRNIGRNAARLHEITEAIVHLEGTADELHDAGLKALYQAHGASSPMAFFVGREVYSHLERVLDRLRGRRRRDPGHRDRPRLMDGYTFTIVALIGVALLFDFLNGLHDAANSIATVVSTRVLSPQMAVVWAAFFNFIAFLFFSHAVANTIGKGIIDPDIVTPAVIFGALMGAIIWNVLTWFLGIPSSSSHALVGGLVGAGVAAGGFSVVVAWGVIKTAALHLPRADPRHG